MRLIFQAPTLLRIIAKSLESLLCSTLGEHNFLSYLQLDVLVVFTDNLFGKCFFVVFLPFRAILNYVICARGSPWLDQSARERNLELFSKQVYR